MALFRAFPQNQKLITNLSFICSVIQQNFCSSHMLKYKTEHLTQSRRISKTMSIPPPSISNRLASMSMPYQDNKFTDTDKDRSSSTGSTSNQSDGQGNNDQITTDHARQIFEQAVASVLPHEMIKQVGLCRIVGLCLYL